jgi:hypothetical protein
MGAAENKELIGNMFAELSKGNAEAFQGFNIPACYDTQVRSRAAMSCSGVSYSLPKTLQFTISHS